MRTQKFDYFNGMMERVLKFKEIDQEGVFHLFEVGKGGNNASVDETYPISHQSCWTVHHVVFRVANKKELEYRGDRLRDSRFRNAGYVDCFFFELLYVKVAPQMLFVFTTDGFGFMEDEPYETLDGKLLLSPFLEVERDEIETIIKQE